MRNKIEHALRELHQLSAATPSSLRGGSFTATIERAEDGEPWVQVKPGVLNIFYPFDGEPREIVQGSVSSFPPDAVCMVWEPWKFATFEFRERPIEQVAIFIEELFTKLYEFPEDTELRIEVVDVRG